MSIIAVVLILISAVFHASWNFLGKRIPKKGETFLVALLAGMVFLIPVGVVYRQAFPLISRQVVLLVIGAGFFQALYFLFLSGAYRHGDLSLAYPIARSSPLIVVTVMSLFLGRGHEISMQAVTGIIIIVAAGFVLPMERLGEFRIRNYINKMSAFALAAAVGTAGYSIIDDAALRILRRPEVLGGMLKVPEISFFYLFLEAVSSAFWLALLVMAQKGFRVSGVGRKPGGQTSSWSGVRPGVMEWLRVMGRPWVLERLRANTIPIIIGVMIYGTYGIVLIAMAHAVNVSYIVAFRQVSLPIGVLLGIVVLKERGGLLRFITTLFLVAGLVLVGTG